MFVIYKMKGVKYNLKIKNPRDDESKNYEELSMKQLIETSEKEIEELYNIKMKITRNKIYNLINRPDTVNKILKEILVIEKA